MQAIAGGRQLQMMQGRGGGSLRRGARTRGTHLSPPSPPGAGELMVLGWPAGVGAGRARVCAWGTRCAPLACVRACGSSGAAPLSDHAGRCGWRRGRRATSCSGSRRFRPCRTFSLACAGRTGLGSSVWSWDAGFCAPQGGWPPVCPAGSEGWPERLFRLPGARGGPPGSGLQQIIALAPALRHGALTNLLLRLQGCRLRSSGS